MATLEEIYRQVISNDDEKAALAEAAKTAEGLKAFLAERGCDAAPEKVAAFLKGKSAGGAEGELADEELDAVAGGCNGDEAIWSISTFGVGCVVDAVKSAKGSGNRGPHGSILCADMWVPAESPSD